MPDNAGKCIIPTREFLESSSLHGVRYLTAEPGRHVCERVMWLGFVSAGIAATLLIIASLWNKFQTSPTITGLDADFHEWDVPFPAVTLCPRDPVHYERLSRFVNDSLVTFNESDGPSVSELESSLATLAKFTFHNIADLKTLSELSIPYISLQSLVLKVTLTCNEVLKNCLWKNKPVNCSDYFHPIFTENGFCFSFNSMFTMDNRATTRKPEFIYETDPAWAISFQSSIAKQNPIRVYIHAWNERLARDSRPHHEWSGFIQTLSFSVKHTYTTENTRQLSIKQRKCVFADELSLTSSDEYSYSACMIECRMTRALEFCQCVPFLSPASVKFPYCDIRGLICLSRYAETLNDMRPCDCELGCDHIIYEVEKLSDTALVPRGTLEVGFVSWPMIRYKREVLFGWVDLLVSFGGIAGLFLGFSLLSGVEIFYYFTMRAICATLQSKHQPSPTQTSIPKRKKRRRKNKVTPIIEVQEYNKRATLKRRKHQSSSFVIPYLP